MKRALTIFLLIIIYIIIGIKPAYAFDLSRSNNKFGIHLAQPQLSDLKKAAEMINSNGGDWGYVTLVIQEDDRKREKWQEVFDLMREYHLIPIIRIATYPEGARWKRPSKEDAQSWADFLDSLHWVVKDRYVILFNEPNHGSEWGGTVDAYDYAETSKEFAEKLKAKSNDFFLMLGAIDASAPSSMPNYLGEEYFFQSFFQKVSVEDYEKLFDGLASHSYPNPAFSGSPWDAGRGTIKTYDWELGLLGRLGVNKKLPVFITETGWSARSLTRETIALYLQTAYQNIWLPDDRIVAVTPFVLDYQGEPFLNFSWKMYQSNEFYPQYYAIQSLIKKQGDPERIDKGEINVDLPNQVVADSSYHLRIKLQNRGQVIWDKKDNYKLQMTNDKSERKTEQFEYFFSDLKNIKPFEETEIDFYLKTNNPVFHYDRDEIQDMKLVLVKNGENVIEKDWKFKIMPLPSLEYKASLYPKLTQESDNFEVQVFDEKEELVFKRQGITLRHGKGIIDAVQNIIPGKKYRIVILKPYYLPRQNYITFRRGANTLKFKRMYPLDLNKNGHFDWRDPGVLIQNPKLMRLFFP